MRFLIIDTECELGGGQISAATLAANLQSKGHRVTVVCPRRGPYSRCLRNRGVDVRFFNLDHRPLSADTYSRLRFLIDGLGLVFSIPAFLRLLAWSKQRPPDIVVGNTFKGALWGSVLARAIKSHSIWYARVFYRHGLLGRMLVSIDHSVVVNSESVRRSFIEGGINPERIHVVYPCIELEPFESSSSRADARSCLGLPESAPVIGFVGRLTPRKGLEELLQAVTLVHLDLPDAHLLIAGDTGVLDDNHGYDTVLKHEARNLGIEDRCHFIGFVEDVPTVMSAIDVLAFPSWREPFGRSVVEAMAAGIPVVASDQGGTREVVQHGTTGYLIPPRNPVALAAALGSILADPIRAQHMGRAGRALARNRFAQGICADRFLSICERLLVRVP